MSDENKNYQNIKVEELGGAQVKIAGEITADKIEESKKKALDKLRQNDIDGFRKGTAPDDVLLNKYGEMGVLQEAAEVALSDEYGSILAEQEIHAIGQPQVSITKIASGEPLGFEINTAVMPEVKLPDYKKVAKEALKNQPTEGEKSLDSEEVSDKEVEDTILQVRRNVASQRRQESGIETPNPDDALPEITDEFVQSLGDFKDVKDFYSKLKRNIKEQKRQQNREKKRLAIMESLVEKSDITLPEIVVKGELDKMISQLKEDVSKAGLDFEDYLKQVGKTEENMREEWKPQAVKKAKSQLILNKIAVEEKLKPDQDQVNQQLERIMAQYPSASRDQAKVFVESQMLNEQVLAMLESQEGSGETKNK